MAKKTTETGRRPSRRSSSPARHAAPADNPAQPDSAPSRRLVLPPSVRDGGRSLAIDRSHSPVLIIGANGSGKTRFTSWLVNAPTTFRPFRLSALHALYNPDSRPDTLPGSIDALHAEAVERNPMMGATAQGASGFDRLISLLLADEIDNLMRYKMQHAKALDSSAPISLPPTPLDTVIRLWQQTFEGNRILVEAGRLLFSRGDSADTYSALRLSDGERAVLYYYGAALYAPREATVFVDNPGMFLHPSITAPLWQRIEELRPDCTFVYTTHDLDFAASRTSVGATVWVRDYDPASRRWDYSLLEPNSPLTSEIYMSIIGARKPVLFIEGDANHSIDAKLYPLIFTDFTVKPLGSCNKVIESTRTFSDLTDFHHLNSFGLVDRDRRTDSEVRYLLKKKIMVPDVAEIENLLMLPDVIAIVARHNGCDPDRTVGNVRRAVIAKFREELTEQALQHTRSRVKTTVEFRIDGRFADINQLEEHMLQLVNEINPRAIYRDYCATFRSYVAQSDYRSILRVYNQKTILSSCGVAQNCGLRSKDDYIRCIISILRSHSPHATPLRQAILAAFPSQLLTNS